MMVNKLYYTDKELKSDLQTICRDMLVNNYNPDYIIGVTRGGLVPSVLISEFLDKPLLTISCSTRSFQHDVDISNVINNYEQDKKYLIVDDIVDSGDTMSIIFNKLEEQFGTSSQFKTACLFYNTAQPNHTPTFYARELNRFEFSDWIVFPFEKWW
jgi:hypoxanthine phosphoribosyltransferase